jgi:hypothetical protein
MSLQIIPDFEAALSLKEHLDAIGRVFEGMSSWAEQSRQRSLAKRRGLQHKLKGLSPSLGDVLGLYTKDQLTGIARKVIQYGGWSSLRKAPLLKTIAEELQEFDTLTSIIENLTPTEVLALKNVIEGGGAISWDVFDAEFGNDLEESPYWHWHPAETVMGRLRSYGLIGECVNNGDLIISIPTELRDKLHILLEANEQENDY